MVSIEFKVMQNHQIVQICPLKLATHKIGLNHLRESGSLYILGVGVEDSEYNLYIYSKCGTPCTGQSKKSGKNTLQSFLL